MFLTKNQTVTFRALKRTPLVWVLLLSTLSCLPAWGQEPDKNPRTQKPSGQKLTGEFVALRDKKVVIDSGSYEVKAEKSKDLQSSLRLITRGQKVELTLDAGAVTDIHPLQPSFEVDGYHAGTLATRGLKWIQLKEGAQFQVALDKMDQVNDALYFVKPGNKIRLTIFNYKVIDLKIHTGTMPDARLPLPKPIAETVAKIGKGDKVLVDKRRQGIVITKTSQSLTIQYYYSDGRTAGKAEWTPLGVIEHLKILSSKAKKPKKNPKADKTDPTSEANKIKDVFARRDIRVGDTVGVGLTKGVLQELKDDEFVLRIWEDNRFIGKRRFRRKANAGKVRRTELASDHRIQTANGEIRVVCLRHNQVSQNELTYKVRINHQIKDKILVNAGLQGYTDGDDNKAAVGKLHKLDPIFAGEFFEWQLVVENQDPNIDLRLRANLETGLVAIRSKRAKQYIGLRLRLENSIASLKRAYEAVALNQAEDLVRVILNHSLGTDIATNVRQEATVALQHCGKATIDVALKDLSSKAEKLTIREVDARGQIIPKPMTLKPQNYRRRLFKLLQLMDRGFDTKRAIDLFDLYLEYEKTALGPLAAETLRAQAKYAARAIATVASTMTDRDQPEKIERINTAAKLLEGLGKSAIGPLVEILEELNMHADARRIRKDSRPAHKVVGDALAVIIRKKRRLEFEKFLVELKTVREEINKGRKLKGQAGLKFWQQLLEKIDKRAAESKEARELKAEILYHKGVVHRQLKERGRAAELLFEAEKICREDKFRKLMPRIKKKLGGVILEAVNEEIESAVLRSGPSDYHSTVKTVRRGDLLLSDRSRRAKDGWLPVLSSGKAAWIRETQIDSSGKKKSQLKVTTDAREISDLRSLVLKGQTYNSALSAQINKANIGLIGREIQDLYRSSRYAETLERMDTLRTMEPQHPALDTYTEVWFLVNWIYPVVIVSLLTALGIFGLKSLIAMKKSSKAKTDADYVFYGKDRAQRERELE